MTKKISLAMAVCLLLAYFVVFCFSASAAIVVGDGGTYTTDESPSDVSSSAVSSVTGSSVADTDDDVFDADSSVGQSTGGTQTAVSSTANSTASVASGTNASDGEDTTVIIIDDGDFEFDADSAPTTASEGSVSESATSSDKLYVSGDFSYIITEDGVTITGYTGISTTVEIPGMLGGQKVFAIGANAFAMSGITEITIPDSVTEIRENAFFGCNDLTTVHFVGTEDQWKAITFADGNDALTGAEVQWATNPLGLWIVIGVCVVFLVVLLIILGTRSIAKGGRGKRRADPQDAP